MSLVLGVGLTWNPGVRFDGSRLEGVDVLEVDSYPWLEGGLNEASLGRLARLSRPKVVRGFAVGGSLPPEPAFQRHLKYFASSLEAEWVTLDLAFERALSSTGGDDDFDTDAFYIQGTYLLTGDRYLHLPPATLYVSATGPSIVISTEVFARQVTLEIEGASGAVFMDNHFDMTPGETRTVPVLDTAYGSHVRVSALNAAPVGVIV